MVRVLGCDDNSMNLGTVLNNVDQHDVTDTKDNGDLIDEEINNNSSNSSGKVEKPKSRRARITLSCIVCRKRKVKCDRGKPHCKTCEKYNSVDLCTYNDFLWSNKSGTGYTFVNEVHNGNTFIDVPDAGTIEFSNVANTTKSKPEKPTSDPKPMTTSFVITKPPKTKVKKNIAVVPNENAELQNIQNIRSMQSSINSSVNSHNKQHENNFNTTNLSLSSFDNINTNPYKGQSSGSNGSVDYNNSQIDHGLTPTPFNTTPYTNPYPNVYTPYPNPNSPQNPRLGTTSFRGLSTASLSPSGIPTANKPILPPLQSLTPSIPGTNMPLQPMSAQNIQNQADLQDLLSKIKKSDVNITNGEHNTVVDATFIDKPKMNGNVYNAPNVGYFHNNIPNGFNNMIQPILSNSSIPSDISSVRSSMTPTIPNLMSNNNESVTPQPPTTDISANIPDPLTKIKTVPKPKGDRISKKTTKSKLGYPEFDNSEKLLTNEEIFQSLGIDDSEILNLYDGFVPMLYKFSRIHNFGPLSWMASLLKDPYISPIRDEVLKHKAINLFSAKDEGETALRDRFLRLSGLDDIKPMIVDVHASDTAQRDPRGAPVINPNSNRSEVKSSMYNKPYDGLDLNTALYHKCFYFNMDFALQQILKVLPNKKVIWLSIKRFFSHVYPMVPYLDQSSFTTEIEKFISGNHFKDKYSDGNVDIIHMTKKMDFAVLGTLLIVLKFSELSLTVNDDCLKVARTKEEQYLIDHPLNERMVNVAQACLNQFKLLRRCTLPIFQLALLMNEYDRFSGMQDGNNSDSRISIVMLVQMAVSIGLNRDPSKFDLLNSKGKMGNLWRKMWYGLISTDIQQYIRFGDGQPCHCDFYDTQLPTFDEESSNIENFDLERIVIEKIKLNYEFNEKLADFASSICSFRRKPSITEVFKQLFLLERQLIESFGTLRDLLKRKSQLYIEKISKLWDFMITVQSIGLIVSIYHQIFVYYQKKSNFRLSKFVKEKSTSIWLYVYANFDNVILRGHEYFGTGFDMFTTQFMLSTLHKGWLDYISTYIVSILARERSKALPNMEKRTKMLERICDQILHSSGWYLPTLKAISTKNFYGWKLLKAHTFLIETVMKSDLIFEILRETYDFMDQMTDFDLLCFSEISNIKNYALNEKESVFFKQVNESVSQNHINHQTKGPSSINSAIAMELSSLDEFIQSKQSAAVVPEKQFSLEKWNKPMVEDTFWNDLFLQRQQNQQGQQEQINLNATYDAMFDFMPLDFISSEMLLSGGFNINTNSNDGQDDCCNNGSVDNNFVNPNGNLNRNILNGNASVHSNTGSSVHSNVSTGENNGNTNGNINGNPNTNLFVDRHIYDMFN